MVPVNVPALVKARTLVALPPLKVVAVTKVGVTIVAVMLLATSIVVRVAPVLFRAVMVAAASIATVAVPETTMELMLGVPPVTMFRVFPFPNRMRLEALVESRVLVADVIVSVLAEVVVEKSNPALLNPPLMASAPEPLNVMAPVAFAKIIVRPDET